MTDKKKLIIGSILVAPGVIGILVLIGLLIVNEPTVVVATTILVAFIVGLVWVIDALTSMNEKKQDYVSRALAKCERDS